MKRIVILILVIALGLGGIVGMAIEAEQAVEAGTKDPEEPVVPPEEPDDIDEPDEKQEPAVTFSHMETFYDETIDVKLESTDPDAAIYYSVDGSEPDETSRLYIEPINIRVTAAAVATTIKAVAIKDGERSAVVNKSYLLGNDVFTRFTPGTYVFILSACPYEMNDRDHGILVEGIIRREFQAGGGRVDNPTAPANYNLRGRAGERAMFVETYDHEGNLLIHQAAGVRVFGGWSREQWQKSLRLIARSEYSKGKFEFPFFDNAVNSDGQQIVKFDQISLRNNGNDRNETAVRDELTQELSRQAGFPDTQKAAPAAVFLNGRYYGFSWMKEAYGSGYLHQMYGGNRENYQTISNNERALSQVDTLDDLYSRNIASRSRTQHVRVKETGDIYRIAELMTNPHWEKLEGDEFRAYNDWHNMYQLAQTAVDAGVNKRGSFTDDKIFEEFCSLVDIENFMLYYAIQIFIDNKDWPGNNYKAWRYYPGEDETVSDSFHDGKWRFLMYDVEFAWGLYGRTFAEQTLPAVLGTRGNHMGGQSVLLQAVLQREDMQEKFMNTMCDLISGPFSSENALSTLESLVELSLNELTFATSSFTLWQDIHGFNNKRDQIRHFAQNRPDFVLNTVRRQFTIEDTDMYNVSLHGAAQGAIAWLNSRRVPSGETMQSAYSVHYGVELRAEVYPGYEFSHWEVNRQEIHEQNLRVDASMADSDGNVYVTLHVVKAFEGLPLFFDEINARSNADWLTLYNPNLTELSTRGFYLSDDAEDLLKWKIPTTTVQPGETLLAVAKNNKSQESLMKLQMNFNLKAGETLYLSDGEGNILTSVYIPAKKKNQILKRQENGKYLLTDPPPAEE